MTLRICATRQRVDAVGFATQPSALKTLDTLHRPRSLHKHLLLRRSSRLTLITSASSTSASSKVEPCNFFLTFSIVPLSQRVDEYLFVILITMNEHLGSINPLATASYGYTHFMVLETTHCQTDIVPCIVFSRQLAADSLANFRRGQLPTLCTFP